MQEGEPILGGGSKLNPNNTQPTNNPGIQQPVVSATPQNTLNPQSQPTAPPSPQTFAPSNTTGGGGQQLNRLAPQQQPYNQPFQQFQQPAQFPAQPITPATNDIILSPTQSKKSRKWIIIVAASIILVATISCIFLLFHKPSSKSSSAADVKTSFNIYANYLLFEKNDSNNPNIDTWSNDKILENLNSNKNESTAYFSNLLNLFNEFSAEIKKGDNNSSNNSNSDSQDENLEDNEGLIIDGLINNATSALETLKTYSELNRYSVVNMVEIFLSQGGEKLIEMVKDSYNNITSSEYSQIREYIELEIKTAVLISDVYGEYTNAGCINGSEIIKDCLGYAALSESYTSNKVLLDSYVSALDDIDYHITNDVVSLSQALYEELNVTEENEQ